MKSWDDATSPWRKRFWYDTAEIEQRMDRLRAKAGPDSFVSGAGVDVDLVLLRCFGIDADYQYLDYQVLGQTTFASDGSVSIELSRELADEAEVYLEKEHRLKSTLAHEVAHVALHAEFYKRMPKPSAVRAAELTTCGVLCRESAIFSSGSGHSHSGRCSTEWWEYQANAGMAALLLPQSLLKSEITAWLHSRRLLDVSYAASVGELKRLTKHLVSVFNVSQQMILIRLTKLGYFKSIDLGAV